MLEAYPIKKNGMKAKMVSTADFERTWVQACGLMGKEKSYNLNNDDNCLPLCLLFILQYEPFCI
jgi:hypothetical protein